MCRRIAPLVALMVLSVLATPVLPAMAGPAEPGNDPGEGRGSDAHGNDGHGGGRQQGQGQASQNGAGQNGSGQNGAGQGGPYGGGSAGPLPTPTATPTASWPVGTVTARRTPRGARDEGGWDVGQLRGAVRKVQVRRPWFDGGRAGPVLGAGWPDFYGWGPDFQDAGWWYEDTWFGGTWGAGGWALYTWGRYPWSWGWDPWGAPWGRNGRYGRNQDPRDAPDWYPDNDGPWHELPNPFPLPNGSWPDRVWGDLRPPDDVVWVARTWSNPYTYGVIALDANGDGDGAAAMARPHRRPTSFYTVDVGVADGGCDRVAIAGPAGFIQAPTLPGPGHIPFSSLGASLQAAAPGQAASGQTVPGQAVHGWSVESGFILAGAVRTLPVVASMDAVDQICLAYTLEQAAPGRTVAWTDPFTHVRYSILPSAPQEVSPGAYCRRYTAQAALDGASHAVEGNACREEGGVWRLAPRDSADQTPS